MRFIAIAVFILTPCASLAEFWCGGPTQNDENICAMEQWQVADNELNRLWKEIKPRADARGVGQALLTEQRAWLKRRDATCQQELAGGGSAAQMFYWSCMEQQTINRNKELATWR
ncbi:lysozyme inhibitor LprI family protein [Ruegeria lacuscaerulensis]|uniref:lysozyme inhibitor LprI family protein n=1 Tax=Ruegeria lacuscaerulensis TaxID=55218 RepID=UPI00147B0B38|nr:lysozyme inhibitor LprI family protein [Ruegeria lacuscaerulensis]